MKVTVVIPSYNSAHWITEAIESALGQTLRPEQIIVVDDGSRDDTADWIKPYLSRGVQYVYQNNAGVSAARNNGVARATGDYVAFLDADDCWHPRKLELQVEVMHQRPDVVMLSTGTFYWPGLVPGQLPPQRWITDITKAKLLIKNRLTTSAILVRKSALEEVGEGPFDGRLQGPEDYDLWLRIAEKGNIARLELPLTGYRNHLDGLGNQARTMKVGLRRILSKLDERGAWEGTGTLVRRRSHAYYHYNCARMYMASGEHVMAMGHVLRSFGRLPIPMDSDVVTVSAVRFRLMCVLALQALGLKTSLRPTPRRPDLKRRISKLMYASVTTPAAGASASETLIGMAFLSLQPIVLSAIALPATLLVIRRLGEAEYGQWVTATSIATTAAILTNLGLRGTFVRAVAKNPDAAPESLGHQLTLRVLLAILAALIGLAACLILRYSWTTIECMAIGGFGLVLLTLFATGSDLLQGLQRFTTVAAVNMIAGLLLTGASVAAVLSGGGAVTVALAYLTGPVVAVIIIYCLLTRQNFPIRLRWDPKQMKRMLSESKYIGVQQFLNPANQNVEALIMPGLLGQTTFGFFSAGSLLPTRLTAIPDGIGTVAYPAIAQKHAFSGRAALRSSAYFIGLVLLVSVSAAIVVSLVAGPVARILFPGRAETCEQVMRITVWLLPLMGMHCILGYALNAVQADAQQAKASLIGSIVSISLAVWMVWQFGITGAAWSIVLRYLLQLAALSPCAYRTAKKLWAEDQETAVSEAAPAAVNAA